MKLSVKDHECVQLTIIYPSIHLLIFFNKYLRSIYGVPGTVLGADSFAWASSFSPMASVTICLLMIEFILRHRVSSELHINHLQDGPYILLVYIPLASPVKIEVFMPLKLFMSLHMSSPLIHALIIYLIINLCNKWYLLSIYHIVGAA